MRCPMRRARGRTVRGVRLPTCPVGGRRGSRCSLDSRVAAACDILEPTSADGATRSPTSNRSPWHNGGMVTRQHPWSRYVALGDSFTEGIGDPEPTVPGGHRGWADRVAEVLSQRSTTSPTRTSRCAASSSQQIVDEQVEPALALQPDLITISAGGNDVIRPGTDPDEIAARFEDADRAALARRRHDRRVHGHRHRLHPGVPRHPRQGRDLQREHPRDRRSVRLRRRRPVGARKRCRTAHLVARPAAPELARPPRGRPHGAARPQRAERPPADAARPAPDAHVAARRAPRTSSGRASTSCRGCCGACATSPRATTSPRSDPTRRPTSRRRTESSRRRARRDW